jgi:Trypsin-co-occurring domain 1
VAFLEIDVNGVRVLVEALPDSDQGLEQMASADRVIRKADEAMRRALGTIGDIAELFYSSIGLKCPDATETSVEFSVAVTGEVDLALVSGSASALAKVTISWSKDGLVDV